MAIVPENEIKSVNYSRGSDVSDIMNFFSLNSSDFEFDKGALSTGLDLSNSLSETKDSIVAEPSIGIEESLLKEPVVGVSLGTVSVVFIFIVFNASTIFLYKLTNLNYYKLYKINATS